MSILKEAQASCDLDRDQTHCVDVGRWVIRRNDGVYRAEISFGWPYCGLQKNALKLGQKTGVGLAEGERWVRLVPKRKSRDWEAEYRQLAKERNPKNFQCDCAEHFAKMAEEEADTFIDDSHGRWAGTVLRRFAASIRAEVKK